MRLAIQGWAIPILALVLIVANVSIGTFVSIIGVVTFIWIARMVAVYVKNGGHRF